MKLTVLYHSVTGNTKLMAEAITEGIQTAENAEAKAFPIEEIDEAWVKESRCVILGTPIYYSSVSAAVKGFLERPFKIYEPAGKIGGAFATANYIHGGGELGIRLILDHMLCHGMLTYSGGYVCGNPVIHLGPVALTARLDESIDTFKLYGQRMAAKTTEIFR
ncbi:MAG: NAD(P)H-dependent oxidoreductase [Defluviitaleaceae bacterium]|nr:NAD(P)H-dependent oxidoreductase [Defluviitaleaceae bacterium]MCL2836549.1 NAD(P)H-dependent oxidoreductase [Defluviitaleaceae bacterium]